MKYGSTVVKYLSSASRAPYLVSEQRANGKRPQGKGKREKGGWAFRAGSVRLVSIGYVLH